MINADALVKRYYKIGEVAKMFGVATSLIRYWETEFSQLKPLKNSSCVRRYRKEDVLIIDQIYELVKLKGYKLDGAKRALRNKTSAKSLSTKNKSPLESLRIELLNMREDMIRMKNEISKLKTEEE